jgi:hypothetical protein
MMREYGLPRLCCLALIIGLPHHANAEELGRLFFTPAERAAMDRGNSGAPAQTEAVPSAPPRISGIVTRSDGRRTVWIDGKPRYDSTPNVDINPRSVEVSPGITISRNAGPHPR